MTNQKEYWNKKILDWEKSNYSKKTVGLTLLEKVATYFRQSNRERANISLEILKNRSKNKKVVELGCGSGFVAFKLFENKKVSPEKYLGFDIAEKAIHEAKKTARQLGLDGKMSFKVGDVNSINFPVADIYFGLGFLNYLNHKELKNLFKKINAGRILFSYAKKEYSLMVYLHKIYTLLSGCPAHYFYTKKEIKKILGKKYGRILFIEKKSLDFDCLFHNFEKLTI